MATEYRVLAKTGEFYDIVKLSIEAASGEQACRLVAKEKATGGLYVAVPIRSWTEQDLYFEQPDPILRAKGDPEPETPALKEVPPEVTPQSRNADLEQTPAA